MFAIDGLILGSALLLVFAIASSKFSAKLGVPVLVVFLALGMLAGSEGIGGIAFENYWLAHAIGTIALVLILFDGGLRTPVDSVRAALKPALTLATVGVLITSMITGLAAAWILGLRPLEGLLLGSIVGSTDAAAVFAALRGQGLRLPQRLSATLEVESGSNDPMAVFLTIGLLEVLLGRLTPGWGMLGFFVLQMGIGSLVGLGVGRLAAELNNRINLAAAGLYPVLMAAAGFLAYGLAASLRGSGFLAVYLAGIVLGNRRIVFQRGIYLFNDGMAWLAQIIMFVMLGLLSFPSRLFHEAIGGLAIAAVLVFIARPVAVAVTVFPFGFNAREVGFLSWAGLKGAVPIILATYPLLLGLPVGGRLFDVVFFVVLISALAQGWTLPPLARKLGLEVPAESSSPVTLEITSLRDVDGDIVEYVVSRGSRSSGRLIRDLALPEGAVVAMITRGREIIPPRGSTAVLSGDHVFLVLRPGVRPLVDRAFSADPGVRGVPLPAAEFPLLARTTVLDLEEFYGISLDAEPGETIGRMLELKLGRSAQTVGARIAAGGVWLSVLEVSASGVEIVGLSVRAADDGPGGQGQPTPQAPDTESSPNG